MDTAIKTLIATLAGLLALSGVAAAQSCPECDENGPANPQNSYHDVDLGVVTDEDRVLADTDASFDEKSADGGFFVWLSLCLNVWIEKIEHALGLDSGVDGNAEVYASEDGVDVDATLRGAGEVVGFDDSPVGDLDGATWDAMAEVGATVREHGAARPELPHPDDTSIEVCLHADLEIVACG